MLNLIDEFTHECLAIRVAMMEFLILDGFEVWDRARFVPQACPDLRRAPVPPYPQLGWAFLVDGRPVAAAAVLSCPRE